MTGYPVAGMFSEADSGMNPEAEWKVMRGTRESRLGGVGMGAVRVALLFGSTAVALALLATPFLERQTHSRTARASLPANLDFMSTGTVGSRNGYTIRRSVLQPSPESVCVIRADGSRAGSC